MADETDLDVDLDVCEQPKQPNFPRLPNVVSRRGHRLKINVTINEIEDDRHWVTISAKVFTYGPEHLGEEAHASRSRKLWAVEDGNLFEINDPEELPKTFSIIVSKQGDEHLGQGPYEAVVTVNASTDRPEDPAAVTEGEEFSIEFDSM